MESHLAQPRPAEFIEGAVQSAKPLPNGHNERRNRIASDGVGVRVVSRLNANQGRMLVGEIRDDVAAEIQQVPGRRFNRVPMRGQLLQTIVPQNAVVFQNQRASQARLINLFEQQDMRQSACPMTGLQIASFVWGKIGRRERSSKAREWDLKAGQTGSDSREPVGVGVAVEDIAGVEEASNFRSISLAFSSGTYILPAPMSQVVQKWWTMIEP